ncbi:MAG: hypothetical protein HY270_03835 [Deltaproteobacteria bacterium]|nr:hypothetical protein [Deltaproteobacteria bacterium]
MESVYRTGGVIARQCMSVTLALFAANLAAGGVFMALGWAWLATNLDGSLASRTLLTDLDMNVFVDLVRHEHAGSGLVLSQGIVLLTVALGFWTWLNGMAAASVSTRTPLRQSCNASLQLYPRLLFLGVVILVSQVVAAAAVFLTAHELTALTIGFATEMSSSGIWVVCLLLGGSVAFLISAIHDHARLHCLATDSTAWRSVTWATRFLLRRAPRALRANLTIGAVAVSTWVIYQSVATMIPGDRMPGVVCLLIWGQAYLMTRMFLRVWLFATESTLQIRQDARVD